MQPRCSRSVAEVWPRCGRGMAEIWPRYGRDMGIKSGAPASRCTVQHYDEVTVTHGHLIDDLDYLGAGSPVGLPPAQPVGGSP